MTRNLRFPDRPATLHKWQAGRVVIVAGSACYPGAPLLVARAALRAGAGLATIATSEPLAGLLVEQLPEATLLPLPRSADAAGSKRRAGTSPGAEPEFDIDAARAATLLATERIGALVVGPGLPANAATVELVRRLLQTSGAPIVLDAGAIGALASDKRADALLADAARTVALTPHVGEFLALSGASVADEQSVAAYSARSGAVVVCKGSTTIVAAPDGRVERRGVPNPLLATGGTGDVLAGVLGALLATEMDAYEAALLAVAWHAAAGERVAERMGEAGLLARELADELPAVRREADSPG